MAKNQLLVATFFISEKHAACKCPFQSDTKEIDCILSSRLSEADRGLFTRNKYINNLKMKLQTPVTDAPCKVGISYNDRILFLGSCFAENIGLRLRDYGFDVLVNPFGTLYNPMSVLSCVRRLVSGVPFSEDECVMMGAGADLVCSFSHHTSFARRTSGEFLENANEALERASAFFRSCNKVIITLGTSWCFRHIEKDFVVSNCLKRPSAEFARERLSPSQVTACLQEIAALCTASSPAESPASCTTSCHAEQKELIFTVSPIRHLADSAHGNQLSKSTLLLGIDALLNPGTQSGVLSCESPGVPTCASPCAPSGMDYFPSYEIVMDELRDYRFYAEDMCHPTRQTEDYILERFLAWALPASEHPVLNQNIRAFKQSRHISNPR